MMLNLGQNQEIKNNTPTVKSQNSDSELKYWVAFSRIQKIGPIKFKKILSYFKNNISGAWQANIADLTAAGIDQNSAQEIVVVKSQINPAQELEKINAENIGVITITDNDYPPLLKEIYNPPYLLYYQGNPQIMRKYCLAVVGTRKYSIYGKQAANDIVSTLSRQGLVIVSGLALGIDALAHQASLEAKGETVAVLGSGLDRQNIYPSANRYLAQKIIANNGCLISEFPAGTTPTKFTFPLRNRLIAGLSLGTLIIEAPESSGALITARHALEQNREVFALPGNIYSKTSAGANNLIKQGAKLVTNANDILEELNLQQITNFIANQKIIPATAEEEIVLKNLSPEPIHIDKLAQSSKIKINTLLSLLTLMEMKGMIKDLGGKNYVLGR